MRSSEDQPHITHVSVPEQHVSMGWSQKKCRNPIPPYVNYQQLTRLLGPSGEGLKELSQQTGAFMSFMPHVQGEPYIVVIQGLPQQVLLSRSLIQVRELFGNATFLQLYFARLVVKKARVGGL